MALLVIVYSWSNVIPLEQGLRLPVFYTQDTVMWSNVIPLEQGLRQHPAASNTLYLTSEQCHSIRTRIKTATTYPLFHLLI